MPYPRSTYRIALLSGWGGPGYSLKFLWSWNKVSAAVVTTITDPSVSSDSCHWSLMSVSMPRWHLASHLCLCLHPGTSTLLLRCKIPQDSLSICTELGNAGQTLTMDDRCQQISSFLLSPCQHDLSKIERQNYHPVVKPWSVGNTLPYT